MLTIPLLLSVINASPAPNYSPFEKETLPGSSDALTHQAAVETCSSQGQRVCTVAELCPNGQPDPSLDVFGSNENWIAVGDSNNEWTTFIRGSRLCKTHSEIEGDKPAWGTQSDVVDFYRSVKCCDKKFDKHSVAGSTAALTYQAAVDTCSSQGQRVCTVAELCPNGQPDPSLDVFGNVRHYIAVGDSKNEWTTFSRKGDNQCKTYSEVTGVAPKWGLNTDANGDLWSRAVKCCKVVTDENLAEEAEKQTNLIATVVSSYQEAADTCSSQGRRICSLADLCPDGQPDPSHDFSLIGEDLIAVGDFDDKWTTTFDSGRGMVCKPFSSDYSIFATKRVRCCEPFAALD